MGIQKCGLNLNGARKEIQPHGSAGFPCAAYHATYRDNPEDAIPWHWHEEIEMLFVKEGGMLLQTPNRIFHLEAGDSAVINSNVLHYAIAKHECELQSLVFSPLLITGSMDSVYAEKYILPLTKCRSFDGCLLPSNDAHSKLFISNFSHAFDALALDVFGYEIVIRNYLSEICLALYKDFEIEIKIGSNEPDQDSFRTRRMLDYLHKNFTKSLSLKEIAEAANIGERECLRCFQRTIRSSPMQYLLKYRIMRAASLLAENPKDSISNISMTCGFESPSNFAQMFKRYYACSPREYRRRLLNRNIFRE